MEQEKIWNVLQNEENLEDNFPEARQRFFVSRLRSGSSVLNIGVGSGALERLGTERGVIMYSLDPSSKAIDRLRSKLDMSSRAQAGYAQSIPFEASMFDAVVASEVFEHLDDDVLAGSLDEITRVLRPGGVLLVSTPFDEILSDSRAICPKCGSQFHKMGHVQSFDKNRMLGLLERHGFCNVRLSVTTFIDWRRAGVLNFVKSLVRLALAKAGQTVADPHLISYAEKPR